MSAPKLETLDEERAWVAFAAATTAATAEWRHDGTTCWARKAAAAADALFAEFKARKEPAR